MKIVKVLGTSEVMSLATNERQWQRIVVVQRNDGLFSVAEQYHYTVEDRDNVILERWATLWVEGIFASLEIAETEGDVAFRNLDLRSVGRSQTASPQS